MHCTRRPDYQNPRFRPSMQTRPFLRTLIIGEWIGYCMDNNIVLMILPPHSSHLTQSLDINLFNSLKRYIIIKIESFIRMRVNWVQKMKWMMIFIETHKKIFIIQNIKRDFHDIGIHSFLSLKVLQSKSKLWFDTSFVDRISSHEICWIHEIIILNEMITWHLSF